MGACHRPQHNLCRRPRTARARFSTDLSAVADYHVDDHLKFGELKYTGLKSCHCFSAAAIAFTLFLLSSGLSSRMKKLTKEKRRTLLSKLLDRKSPSQACRLAGVGHLIVPAINVNWLTHARACVLFS